MNKVTIIGAGNVGATIAYTMTYAGIASDILLIDVNHKKAEGEALDIRQGTPYCPPCNIYAGDYCDAVDSDIVVVTSGLARKPGQTRLELTQANVDIIRDVAPKITEFAPNAIYVIVSNPVDILTYAFCKFTNIPENHIIGSGTILDTSRLRANLAEYYQISKKNVHAFVLGEHGDSSIVPWSICNFSNIPVLNYTNAIRHGNKTYPKLNTEEVEQFVRSSGTRIIEMKGATYYAVSICVCQICRCILTGVDTALTVSTMLHGEYGIEDVALSILCNIGKNGIHSKLILPITADETIGLQRSAKALKDVIDITKF